MTQAQTPDKAVCQKHGEYISSPTNFNIGGKTMTVLSGCPKCADERAAIESEKRKEEYNSHLVSCGITQRFRESSFDNYLIYDNSQKHVLSVCQNYADRISEVCSTGENLLMIGAPGTGKNHLATAILKRFIDFGKTARLIKVYKFLRQIKETYSGGGEKESDIMKRALRLDLLILDEWGFKSTGSGELSETDKALIFELVDDRYEALKPTVIISNLNITDLEKYIGEDRVLGRLRQDHQQLIFNWANYRDRCKK